MNLNSLILPKLNLSCAAAALFFATLLISSPTLAETPTVPNNTIETPESAPEQDSAAKRAAVRAYVPPKAIIAHRGTTYWAPEETEAAFRWARNMGADYLEADLQLTRDGKIILVHDDNFLATTDVATVFPQRKKDPVNTFTYEEILRLSAGSAFNDKNPERARESFRHLEILTLEDLSKIAAGYRLKRDATGKREQDAEGNFLYVKDESDNGNRPGIYLETKNPERDLGIEKKLKAELERLNWDITATPATSEEFYRDGKVNAGNTRGKVVLQSFSKPGIRGLNAVFHGELPSTFLFDWYDNLVDTKNPGRHFLANLDFAVKENVNFIGPPIYGFFTRLDKTAYKNILHEKGLGLHPYSFNSADEIRAWQEDADGMFTNRTDLNLPLSKKPIYRHKDAKRVLDALGY